MVIWDKGKMGMGWHYRRSYETVLVAQKRGGPCKWYDESHKIENIIRPGDYGIRKIIPTIARMTTTTPQLTKNPSARSARTIAIAGNGV